MKTSSHSSRCGAISPISALILTVSLSLSGFCFRKAAPETGTTNIEAQTSASALAASQSETRTKPIEQIVIGDRVIGHSPITESSNAIEQPVNALCWRQIEMHVTGENGHQIRINLLRPSAWVTDHGFKSGKHISVDLSELNAVGTANILSITPCPSLTTGPGNIVTGTFHHDALQLVELTLSGETVSTTSTHPIWSEDQQDFIPAGRLRRGECVRTLQDGAVHLDDVRFSDRSEPVFNIEVNAEHVYHVGHSGLLVHNKAMRVDMDMTRVTSWADEGITPDLQPGRWVQIGNRTRLNYIKTGLPGPKAYLQRSYPWVKFRSSRAPFSNAITEDVPTASLRWPSGWDKWRGMFGQRIID